uniref:Putative ribonuclease H-like domain-containing protein n=1 Tax=Tanacetum cinerariifolium TaxID=118510 RepID=A0A699IBC3_TANCI|nr:putative ribonuclease H-like domain-containing protein [Tanacetum cinerariifolium]
MDQDSAHMVAASKVHMLKPGVTQEMSIIIAEEKAQRRLKVKARSTLMMGISNEYHLKFNSIKDAKQLLEAVEKRFASQLELLGEKPSQEDVNQKLLRSLSPEWKTHVIVWRNKADLDTMSITKGAVNNANGVSTFSTQVSAAFSTNINNLSDAVICAFLASQPNSHQLVHEDLEQIHPDDMEEMYLRCLHEFVNKPVVENCNAKSSEEEAKGNPQMDLQDQGVIDSGCLRHMTRNMSYLTDYKEIARGYVAFRGNLKREKITGKATKDDTSGIIKFFITKIENLVDHKVKVIRCDNGIEFKNREMNQFCEMKGIIRQFSVARTPQQNVKQLVLLAMCKIEC